MCLKHIVYHFFLCRCDPTRVMAFSLLKLLYHAQRRTTVGRNPLDEWSARRRDLYLTTHDIHNRQISMTPVDSNPRFSRQASADLHLRRRGHWDQHILYL